MPMRSSWGCWAQPSGRKKRRGSGTPPVVAVTDAVIVARAVSGGTFVIGSEMTRRRLAERAIETITSTHPRVTAVVLNKVDFERNKYYYSRHYGHQYKNYYAEAAV